MAPYLRVTYNQKIMLNDLVFPRSNFKNVSCALCTDASTVSVILLQLVRSTSLQIQDPKCTSPKSAKSQVLLRISSLSHKQWVWVPENECDVLKESCQLNQEARVLVGAQIPDRQAASQTSVYPSGSHFLPLWNQRVGSLGGSPDGVQRGWYQKGRY